MLEGIRRASGTWLGKGVLVIMFSFLIFSFAIWGIGDIFKGYGSSTLAQVGKTEIGLEPFRRAFQQRIYEIQQRSRGFTTEQARLVGIDRQVLNQMMGEAALNETGRRLGLAISDEDIAKTLAANPNFRAADGSFSRAVFDAYIREAGQNEAGFIQQQKQATLRQHLGEAITGGYNAPLAFLETLHRYRSEERTIAYVTIPGTIASALQKPDDIALKALHAERKASFRAPEYRKILVMSLSPSEFASEVQVSDQELQAAYDRGLATNRFGSAEKRQIQQIVFPNAPAALAASERLKAGLTFDLLAEEMKLKSADLDLGLKAKAELADKTIANAAFELAENAISSPVQGAFGAVLLRVTGITAGTAQAFDSLKETLKADVISQKLTSDRTTRDKVDKVHDKIEELRATGKSLDLVATDTKRTLITIDATDAQGRDKAGTTIDTIPDMAEVLKAVFQSDRGVDNEAIRTRDNGYVWFEISTIEPARERSFDEVKDLVSEVWLTNEATKLSSERATAFLKRVENNETLELIATELGVSVETATGVTRNGNQTIGPSAAASAFALIENGYAVAPTGVGTDRMLMKMTSRLVPPFDLNESNIKSLRTQLDSTISDELLSQFVSQAQSFLGSSINEPALSLATGAQQQQR
jgi:peptidyl-prolyl cis-trans isomerase D